MGSLVRVPSWAKMVAVAACFVGVLGLVATAAQAEAPVTVSGSRAVSAGGACKCPRSRHPGATLVRAQRKVGRRWLTVVSGTTTRAGCSR